MNRFTFAVAIVIGITALSLAQTRQALPPDPVSPVEATEEHSQWEYREIHSATPNIPEFNKLGREGWELSECHPSGSTTYYIFIRPKYDTPTEEPTAKQVPPPAKGSPIQKYFK